MSTRNTYWQRSAQAVDPLSWFTGTNMPLAAAALFVVYSLTIIVGQWSASTAPVLQVLAMGLALSAMLLVHVASRPMRPPIGWPLATLAYTLTVAAITISAFDYVGRPLVLELWWAPGALTLISASLAAFVPATRLIALGSASTIVTIVLGTVLLHPAQPHWGIVGTAVIIGYAPIIGVIATATFSYSIVSTILPMLESPSRIIVAGRDVVDAAADEVERVTLAQLTARAAPFIEGIAERGVITPEERALAGQLARRIRDDLVTQSNVTWLESIADHTRLVVVDPHRRARTMDNAQRTALRALLQAILDTPGTDAGSLLVELREAPDGATAVGVSLDIALPEGLRIMHLAPYLLTLGTAVDDLKVDRDVLGVTFRIKPGGERS